MSYDIQVFLCLLIAIDRFPYYLFHSFGFIKLNSVFVRLSQSSQEMMDFYFFIFDVPDIPQQIQDLFCILFHGQLSQSQLMELFDFFIIVSVREVLLLEILLEPFPHNLPFINIFHLPEVLPPYGCSSCQIEDGYPSLHISRLVLDLEIFSHPKNPSFSFLTILYLIVEGRRPSFLNSSCEQFW